MGENSGKIMLLNHLLQTNTYGMLMLNEFFTTIIYGPNIGQEIA